MIEQRNESSAATASSRERVLRSDFGRMRIEYVGDLVVEGVSRV